MNDNSEVLSDEKEEAQLQNLHHWKNLTCKKVLEYQAIQLNI